MMEMSWLPIRKPDPLKGGNLPDPYQDRKDRFHPFPSEEIQPPGNTTVKTPIQGLMPP